MMKTKVKKDYGNGYYIIKEQLGKEYAVTYHLKFKRKYWFDKTLHISRSYTECTREYEEIQYNTRIWERFYD